MVSRCFIVELLTQKHLFSHILPEGSFHIPASSDADGRDRESVRQEYIFGDGVASLLGSSLIFIIICSTFA